MLRQAEGKENQGKEKMQGRDLDGNTGKHCEKHHECEGQTKKTETSCGMSVNSKKTTQTRKKKFPGGA